MSNAQELQINVCTLHARLCYNTSARFAQVMRLGTRKTLNLWIEAAAFLAQRLVLGN